MPRMRLRSRSGQGSPPEYTSASNGKKSSWIHSKAIPCPTCDAKVGGECISVNGKPTKTVHVSRKRIATRLQMQEKEREQENSKDSE